MNGSMEEMFLAQLAKRRAAGENKKKPCQPSGASGIQQAGNLCGPGKDAQRLRLNCGQNFR